MLRFVRFKLTVKCQTSSQETCVTLSNPTAAAALAEELGLRLQWKADIKHQPSGCIPNTQCKKTWGCPRKQKNPNTPADNHPRRKPKSFHVLPSVGMYCIMSRRKTRRGCFWRWNEMKLWWKGQLKMALRDSRCAQNGMRWLHNSSFIGFYKTTCHQWDHKTHPSS